MINDEISFSGGTPSYEEFTHLTIKRAIGDTIIHTTENVDGVIFYSVQIYDVDGRLKIKKLTRGDLIQA